MADYQYTDLTLHGRVLPDGEHFGLFVLLNGVEVPVQTLRVSDYREKFEEASNKGTQAAHQQQQASEQSQPQ